LAISTTGIVVWISLVMPFVHSQDVIHLMWIPATYCWISIGLCEWQIFHPALVHINSWYSFPSSPRWLDQVAVRQLFSFSREYDFRVCQPGFPKCLRQHQIALTVVIGGKRPNIPDFMLRVGRKLITNCKETIHFYAKKVENLFWKWIGHWSRE
jgi:hypothetical protein